MSGIEVTDNDKMYCETIAKSISDIIRFSLNEEYRKKSCDLFGVFSTKDVENEINKRLISVLEKESTSVKKKHKNETNKENVEEQDIVFGEKATDESSNSNSTDSSCQTTSQNPFQKNWLQISSQQYRDVIKRKKLQFHSQPHYAEPHEKNPEFLSSSLNFNNSQPVSDIPSSLKLSEMTYSSDEGVTFCKKKFKQSLRDSTKYLKRNSKYHKRIGF